MGDSSGGKKPTRKTESRSFIKNIQKIRSNSVGSLNLTKSEVNNIIGVKVDQSNERDKITTSSSGDTGQGPIPGTIEKCGDDENGFSLATGTYEDVFRPKKSVARTPTKSVDDVTYFEENSNKRPRSDTTPEADKSNKRQCDRIMHGNIEISTAETLSNLDKPFSIDQMLKIFGVIDKLSMISERDSDENGNIYLSKEDQKNIREANSEIHKFLTLMTLTVKELENENAEMRHKFQTFPNIIGKTGKSENNIKGKKSYAEIITENNALENTEQAETSSEQQWTTPKTRKKHETVIRFNNVDDSKEAKKSLKKEINMKNIGKGFKNIRETKTGAIVVESYDKNQQQLLNLEINKLKNVQIKENDSSDPMFMITGIEKGFTDDEFVDELERLNPEITTQLQTSIKDKIKIITKRQCRNPGKENWILQAPPSIAKWFLKKQTVYFDLVTVYVQEYLNVALFQVFHLWPCCKILQI